MEKRLVRHGNAAGIRSRFLAEFTLLVRCLQSPSPSANRVQGVVPFMIVTAAFAMQPTALPFEMTFKNLMIAAFVVIPGFWLLFISIHAVQEHYWLDEVDTRAFIAASNATMTRLFLLPQNYWMAIQKKRRDRTNRSDGEEMQRMNNV